MITAFILALLGLCIYIAADPKGFAYETNRVLMKIGRTLGYVVGALTPCMKTKNKK